MVAKKAPAKPGKTDEVLSGKAPPVATEKPGAKKKAEKAPKEKPAEEEVPDDDVEASAEDADEPAEETADDEAGEQDEQDAAEEADEPEADEEDEVASYDDLELPEDSGLEDDHLDAVKELAKKLKLDPTQAKALLEHDLEVVAGQREANLSAWSEQRKTWYQQALKHKELGAGKKSQLKAVGRKGDLVLTHFWPKDFVQEVLSKGFGSHPGFLRGLLKIHGETGMGEPDSVIPAAGAAGAEGAPTDSEVMYDNTPGVGKNKKK